ncbi:MAG: RNA polymerase sigma factor [Prosthecobacter sp.]|uniref:RNA polymerase sigma factor n=1 Tax=Prosthecobacter sp. TaxID=1965333 RepID=UPI003902CFC1
MPKSISEQTRPANAAATEVSAQTLAHRWRDAKRFFLDPDVFSFLGKYGADFVLWLGAFSALTAHLPPAVHGTASCVMETSIAQPHLFPTTDWGALRKAANESWTEVQVEAISHLYEAYARPLKVFVGQRWAVNAGEQEDLVHGFFEHALSRDIVRGVMPRETRFRSFLLGAFSNWLTDEHRRRAAVKRGGGATHESLHDELEAAHSAEESSRAYDREWAGATLRHTIERMRHSYEQRGRSDLFEALKGVLPGSGAVRPYAEIAEDLGMTEPAVRKAAFQLRATCANLLRVEVSRTVSDLDLVDEELRYLVGLIRSE